MNSKFEKFKSKEMSQVESKAIVGGDYIDCVRGCLPLCAAACSGLSGEEFGNCVDECNWNCTLGCAASQ